MMANKHIIYHIVISGNRARVPRSPLAILMIQNMSSVAIAVSCARQNGIAVVARSGGHSYEVEATIHIYIMLCLYFNIGLVGYTI